MSYATNRDREPSLLELTKTPWPVPPLTLFLTSGYKPGVFDLVWTDPSDMALNGRFQICGVNVYRSFDSEFGPYDRVNEYPLGANFLRDLTDNVLVIDEEVTDDQWLMRGYGAAAELESPRYVFRTTHYPIVKEGSQKLPTSNVGDVEVRIDGVTVKVLSVLGESGEIEVDPNYYPNVALQTRDPSVLPDPGTKVTVTYRHTRSFLRTDLVQRVFYRVTAVGHLIASEDGLNNPTELLETPLERGAFTSSYEIEKIDYIWREAVRRNRWILDQGGERVKLYIRKQVGVSCSCVYAATHHQPLNDCLKCYGTGVLGGYEGPYDILLAPDNGEKKISQKDSGRTVEHTYDFWTGPSPLLSQRDFVVKLNGERYSIGAVQVQTNRGMVLQQNGMLGHLDEKDIRYKVPIDNPSRYLANQVQPAVPPMNSPAQITDKPNIPDERELRGRTIAWENIVYGVLFLIPHAVDALHRYM